MIDKLTQQLRNVKEKHKGEGKLLKKTLREKEKLKKEVDDLKMLRLSLKHQEKIISRVKHNPSPGKASKKSPIGVLSPSPSPPPSGEQQEERDDEGQEEQGGEHSGEQDNGEQQQQQPQQKQKQQKLYQPRHKRQQQQKVNTLVRKRRTIESRVKSQVKFVPTDVGNLSSSSEDEANAELEAILKKSAEQITSSASTSRRSFNLFEIPSFLSPVLSPLPPSPVHNFNSNDTTLVPSVVDDAAIKANLLNDSLNSSLFGDVSITQSSDEEHASTIEQQLFQSQDIADGQQKQQEKHQQPGNENATREEVQHPLDIGEQVSTVQSSAPLPTSHIVLPTVTPLEGSPSPDTEQGKSECTPLTPAVDVCRPTTAFQKWVPFGRSTEEIDAAISESELANREVQEDISSSVLTRNIENKVAEYEAGAGQPNIKVDATISMTMEDNEVPDDHASIPQIPTCGTQVAANDTKTVAPEFVSKQDLSAVNRETKENATERKRKPSADSFRSADDSKVQKKSKSRINDEEPMAEVFGTAEELQGNVATESSDGALASNENTSSEAIPAISVCDSHSNVNPDQESAVAAMNLNDASIQGSANGDASSIGSSLPDSNPDSVSTTKVLTLNESSSKITSCDIGETLEGEPSKDPETEAQVIKQDTKSAGPSKSGLTNKVMESSAPQADNLANSVSNQLVSNIDKSEMGNIEEKTNKRLDSIVGSISDIDSDDPPDDSDGALGDSDGAPCDSDGAPGDSDGAPGDSDGAPGDSDGAPGDDSDTNSGNLFNSFHGSVPPGEDPDENPANTSDDLDSEVASFNQYNNTPVQRCILYDPCEASKNAQPSVSQSSHLYSSERTMYSSSNTQLSYSSSTTYHTVYTSPSSSSRNQTLPNSCQCSTTSTAPSAFWAISYGRRHHRRHSTYAHGITTIATTPGPRLERTKSLSPSLFSPPSPPLSPLPPSPRRSMLTPIISPLPTTPVPESVSPLPPSPKITSPPLIRSSAVLRTDDPLLFVPKPLSHGITGTTSAAKALRFGKNDSPRSRKKDHEARRNALEAHRARSCSPSLPKKKRSISKKASGKSSSSSSPFSVSFSPCTSAQAPVTLETSFAGIQSSFETTTSQATSCRLHNAITKPSCYPYTTEEHKASNSNVPSMSTNTQRDAIPPVLTTGNPVATMSSDSCSKVPCGTQQQYNSIQRRIKSMKSKSKLKSLGGITLNVAAATKVRSAHCSPLTKLPKSTTPYSSSTITKPPTQVSEASLPSTSPSSSALLSKSNELHPPGEEHENSIAGLMTVGSRFSPINVNNTHIWRRVEERNEKISKEELKQTETSEHVNLKKLKTSDVWSSGLSTDDDVLQIASEANDDEKEDSIRKCADEESSSFVNTVETTCSSGSTSINIGSTACTGNTTTAGSAKALHATAALPKAATATTSTGTAATATSATAISAKPATATSATGSSGKPATVTAVTAAATTATNATATTTTTIATSATVTAATTTSATATSVKPATVTAPTAATATASNATVTAATAIAATASAATATAASVIAATAAATAAMEWTSTTPIAITSCSSITNRTAIKATSLDTNTKTSKVGAIATDTSTVDVSIIKSTGMSASSTYSSESTARAPTTNFTTLSIEKMDYSLKSTTNRIKPSPLSKNTNAKAITSSDDDLLHIADENHKCQSDDHEESIKILVDDDDALELFTNLTSKDEGAPAVSTQSITNTKRAKFTQIDNTAATNIASSDKSGANGTTVVLDRSMTNVVVVVTDIASSNAIDAVRDPTSSADLVTIASSSVVTTTTSAGDLAASATPISNVLTASSSPVAVVSTPSSMNLVTALTCSEKTPTGNITPTNQEVSGSSFAQDSNPKFALETETDGSQTESRKSHSEEEGEISDNSEGGHIAEANVTKQKPPSQMTQAERLKQLILKPPNANLKPRRRQSEPMYAKKCFYGLRQKVLSKRDCIHLLCQKSNLSNMQALSNAVIIITKSCEETLLHKVLKQLEDDSGTCTCWSKSKPNKQFKCGGSAKCANVKCVCKGNNIQNCTKCGNISSNDDQGGGASSSSSRERDIFRKCHPGVERLSTPVLTSFEEQLLPVLVAVMKGVKFKTDITLLLNDLQAELMKEEILVIERMSLCRMFAALCRMYGRRDHLISFMYSIAYDTLRYLSFSMVFVTCYTVWPCVLHRSDLIELQQQPEGEGRLLKLGLNKVKLSPLSAVLQTIALVESVRKKESNNQKILEKLMGFSCCEENCVAHLQQMADELLTLLENVELSFLSRDPGRGVTLCGFAFTCMKGLELICRRMGWQWTYNNIILDNVRKKLVDAVKEDSPPGEHAAVTSDTLAIFIWLSGFLCEYGLQVDADLEDYCRMLVRTLKLILQSGTVVDGVETALVHSLLVLAPIVHTTQCHEVINNWLLQSEARQVSVSPELSNAITELKEKVS